MPAFIARMLPMRRFIAAILLVLLPLQFAWSAIHVVHGNYGDELMPSGYHVHADDDHHDAHHDDAPLLAADFGFIDGSSQDHHDGHFHPVLNLLVAATATVPQDARPYAVPLPSPQSFTTRTPPLFDRPPARS